MNLNNYNIEFEIGDFVYLRTDPDQKQNIIVGIELQPDYNVQYRLHNGTECSYHHRIEISKERELIDL